MKKHLFILLLILLAGRASAVETILVGTVHDGPTGEPLQNAEVYFRGTQVGTTTDSTGLFFLRVDMQAKAKLIVKMVGYKRLSFDIEPGQSAGMELYMQEKVNALAEVTALPGEDPAIRLMQAARQRKKGNAAVAAAAGSELPTELHYYLSDIRPKHLESRLWKQYAGSMVLQADSSYLMPLPDEGYKQYMVPMPEHFSFYQNTLSLGEAGLLSPLANNGGTFYRYWLLDSSVVAYQGMREKHYRIRYLPRNPFNPTLEGTLELDSATLALREVTASVPREVNINYLTGLHYRASYAPTGALTYEQLATVMEVNAKRDTTHTFPSLLTIRRNGRSEAQHPDTLQALGSTASAYLNTRLPQAPVVPDDSTRMALQAELTERPFFRFARWVGYTALTGYMPTGSVIEVGNITEIFKYTPVEHLHLGLPFRTSEALWKNVSLGAYVGYGWRDRGVKYKVEMQALLPTEKRQMLGLSVSDHYTYTEISPFEQQKNENGISGTDLLFTSYLLNGVSYAGQPFRTEARQRELRLYAESEWVRGSGSTPYVETLLSAQMGHQGYGDPLAGGYRDMASYRYASVRAYLRLGWGEKKADFYMHRRHEYGGMPTLWIGGEMGSYHLDGEASYQTYGKLEMMLRQDVRLGIAGRLYYLVQAGVVAGAVPYPLLEIFNGNRGVTYSPDRFTLMNNGQYAADRYLSAQLHYDGRGVVFNQIPGIRYLRLHELLEAKMAWGGLSNKHRQVLDFPTWGESTMLQSLRIPYAEVGCGVGNILGVADVMAVWRLTHRDDQSAARWGIRFRMHLCL